jgi:hypothetical protein
MAYRSSRLPSRFPVGTKFVIEGRRAGEGEVQVIRRYLEFPNGKLLQLPARPKAKLATHRARSLGRRASEPVQAAE